MRLIPRRVRYHTDDSIRGQVLDNKEKFLIRRLLLTENGMQACGG